MNINMRKEVCAARVMVWLELIQVQFKEKKMVERERRGKGEGV